MKKIFIGIVIGISCVLYAIRIEPVPIAEKPIPDVNKVETNVTYEYRIPVSDGTEKVITSKTVLDKTALDIQAKALIQAQIDRKKEIEVKVKAMTEKNTLDMTKEWKMYGKVIQYNYRVKLPDGSRQWLNSKKPLEKGEQLKRAKAMYQTKLEETNDSF